MAELGRTIEDVIRAHALRAPGSPVLVAPGYLPLSYSELLSETGAARVRVRHAGFAKSSRIAVVVRDRPQAYAAMLIFSCAATVTLLNPESQEDEFLRNLVNFRADLVVVSEGLNAATAAAYRLNLPIARLKPRPGAASGLFDVEIPSVAPPVTNEDPMAEDIALILMTSGTTARPKSVPLTHEMMVDRAWTNTDTLALVSQDVCINFRPAYLGGGINVGLMGSVHAGGCVVIPGDFDADEFFRLCDAFKVTWYAAGPAYHSAILERAPEHADIISRWLLRLVRSASYHLPEDLRMRLEKELGVRVIQKYGLTEMSIIASESLSGPIHRKNTVGLPYECEVRILDESGRECGPGQEGEIVARGHRLFHGYDGDAELTTKTVVDGWFHTGDVGTQDADGYLSVTGRLSDVINRGGQKVSPKEVEDVLSTLPGVMDNVCFAMPHPTLGQIAGVAVVAQPGTSFSEEDIKLHLRQRLARYKVPDRVIFRESIPRAPGGKFKRNQAVELLGLQFEDRQRDEAAEAGRSPLARKTAAIWCDALGVDFVLDDDNFVLLGGDSLQAMRMIIAIEEAFGVSLSVDAIFGAGATIPGMAEEISKLLEDGQAQKRDEQPATIPPRSDSSEAPLSFAQERMWIIAKADPSRKGLLGGNGLIVKGRVDIDKMGRAIAKVIERHEGFRAYFPDVGGIPRQCFAPFEGFRPQVVDFRNLDQDNRQAEMERQAYAMIKAPYDITTGPLYRFCIYILSDDESAVVRSMHHLINDGLTTGIVFREIMDLYEAEDFEEAARLLPKPTPFGDFASWQREKLSGPAMDRIMNFWKTSLAEVPPVMTLPLVQQRPKVADYAGCRLRIEIPPDLTARLRDLSARQKTTLFVTTLAAFEALIYRTTGQTDFIVGSGADTRPPGYRRTLLGYCFNLLPLRVRPAGETKFSDFVSQARETVSGAIENREVPFEQIMKFIEPPRSRECHPIIQTLFGFIPKQRRSVQEARYLELDLNRDTSRFDLSLMLEDIGDCVSGFIEYRLDLYSEKTAAHLLKLYLSVLEQVTMTPEIRLMDLELLDAEEKGLVDGLLQGPTRAYREDATISDLFAEIAGRMPDKPAIVDGDFRVTFECLDAWSDRIAAELIGRGLGANEIVAVSAERTAALIASILGILKAGAAYLPIDPAQPELRQAQILELAGVKRCLVQEGSALAKLAEIERIPTPLRPAAGWKPDRASSRMGGDPDALAFVLFTSGSTGEPKGVCHSHRAVARQIADRQVGRLGPDRVFFQLAPPTFDVATFDIWCSILNGGTLVLPPYPLTGMSELADLIRAHGTTTLQMTPALFHMMLDTRPDAFEGVEQLLVGGDIMSAPHVRKFLHSFPECDLINVYAPTEFSVWAVSHKIGAGTAIEPAPPIGTPVDNTWLRILDEAGKQVPVGVPGELCIGGPGLALGYLGRPDMTSERFSGDGAGRLYHTGDIVVLGPNGDVSFVRRKDQQLKIRGFLVEPAEVEAAIVGDPAVREACVIALKEPGVREQLVAFAVPTPGKHLPSDSGTVLRNAGTRLPHYMVPARLIWIDALPLTGNNKVDRRRLSELALETEPEQASAALPQTDVELSIERIWCDLLNRSSCGLDEPFFELGGDSLLMMQALFRIQGEMGIEFPLEAAFGRPTIRGMADQVMRRKQEPTAEVKQPVRPSDPLIVPLTLPDLWEKPEARAKRSAFIVSGGGGHVQPFAPVAEALAPAWQTIGLLDPHFLASEARPNSLESLATRYVRAIQRHQPEGPYHLVGYSFGGLVVHEIARQLEEKGFPASIILLDTRLRLKRPRFIGPQRLVIRVKYSIRTLLNFSGNSKFRRFWTSSSKSSSHHQKHSRILTDRKLRRKMLMNQRLIGRSHMPRPTDVPTFLIRAKASWRESDTEDYGWSAVARVVGTSSVPGDHITLFKGANEAPFVAALNEALESAAALWAETFHRAK